MGKTRRLAAIVFTDIVGYSAIMQRDEQRGELLRHRHREVFDELTLKHDGKILQYFGDGTLSIFDSAIKAVECAVEMQQKFAKDPVVPLRVGIHTGDIVYDEDEIFGDGVNVAKRIESECIPGGVYLSSKVYDDIKNHPWLQATSLGEFQLKNIVDPIEIYAIKNVGPQLKRKEQTAIPKKKGVTKPPMESPALNVSSTASSKTGKSKNIAAFLSLILGGFGVGRFYLGDKERGLGYLFVAIAILFILDIQWLSFVPGLIGLIEAYHFFTMSEAEFDMKYSKKVEEKAPEKKPKVDMKKIRFNALKQRGLDVLERGKLEEAIIDLKEAAKINDEDDEVWYGLAQAYALERDEFKALKNLEKAIQLNEDWVANMESDKDLIWLRAQKLYTLFCENDFKVPEELPRQEEDLLQTEPGLTLKKLDEIEELGQQLERGLIDESEFNEKKRIILGNENF